MESRGKIEFANTLRGFAAVFVLISHYYGVFWLNRSATASLIHSPELPISTHAVPNYIALINSWSSFDAGAFGVALFFLISGFVIPFSLSKVGGLSFLIGRGFRIVPTYVVGFTISLMSLWLIGKYFSVAWPFSGKEVFIHYVPGLRDMLWSRNIDGIIWTLEIEVKFYLLCAVVSSLFKERSAKVFLVPLLIIPAHLYFSGLLPALLQEGSTWYTTLSALVFSATFVVFMFIGVAFHYSYQKIISERKTMFLVALLFAAFCYLWQSGPLASSKSQLWSYGFALLVFIFAYAFPTIFKANKFFDFLANISYPLYVVHGVGGYALLRVLLHLGLKAWVSLIIVTCTAIGVAWLLHVLVENPSQRLGKMVMKLFPSKRTDQASASSKNAVVVDQ